MLYHSIIKRIFALQENLPYGTDYRAILCIEKNVTLNVT